MSNQSSIHSDINIFQYERRQAELRSHAKAAAAASAEAKSRPAALYGGRVASHLPYGGLAAQRQFGENDGQKHSMSPCDHTGAGDVRAGPSAHVNDAQDGPTSIKPSASQNETNFGAGPNPADATWLGRMLAESMLACFASASGSENGPSPFPASQSVPPRPGVDGLRQISALQTALNRRLGPEYIQTRAGYGTGGKKLSYLEGWKAIDLANEVFGFNGWSTSIVRMDTDFCDVDNDGKVRIGMSCIIRITLRDGTFHEDVGYGAMEGSKNKGQAFEKARKEATTDAFKRALRSFGRMVGNCLYDRTFTDQLAKQEKAAPATYDMSDLKRAPDPGALKAAREQQAAYFAEYDKQQMARASPIDQSNESSRSAAQLMGPPPVPANRTNKPISAAAPQATSLSRAQTMPRQEAPQRQRAVREPERPLQHDSSSADSRVRSESPDKGRAERLALAAQKQEDHRLRRSKSLAPIGQKPIKSPESQRMQQDVSEMGTASRQSFKAHAPDELRRPTTAQMMSDVGDAEMSEAVALAEQRLEQRPPPQWSEVTNVPMDGAMDHIADGDHLSEYGDLEDDDAAAAAMYLELAAEEEAEQSEPYQVRGPFRPVQPPQQQRQQQQQQQSEQRARYSVASIQAQRAHGMDCDDSGVAGLQDYRAAMDVKREKIESVTSPDRRPFLPTHQRGLSGAGASNAPPGNPSGPMMRRAPSKGHFVGAQSNVGSSRFQAETSVGGSAASKPAVGMSTQKSSPNRSLQRRAATSIVRGRPAARVGNLNLEPSNGSAIPEAARSSTSTRADGQPVRHAYVAPNTGFGRPVVAPLDAKYAEQQVRNQQHRERQGGFVAGPHQAWSGGRKPLGELPVDRSGAVKRQRQD